MKPNLSNDYTPCLSPGSDALAAGISFIEQIMDLTEIIPKSKPGFIPNEFVFVHFFYLFPCSNMDIHEIIGWVGALLFIVAYFLLSIKKLRPDKLPYQALNILGGICLVINSFHTHDYPSVLTNLIWAGIGVFAIYFNRPR